MPDTRNFIARDDAQPPFFVGLDLGGTNIKGGVVDDRGRPLCSASIPTDREKGAESASERMGKFVRRLAAKAKLKLADVAAVGLGSPGTMDIPAGKLVDPANLEGWENFPIRDRVSHHCGFPVTFANDARAAAYGEKWTGSGQSFHSMILLTLGTGVGCGIILGDEVLDGRHSHGGEFGHTIIDIAPNARSCGCGRLGHFEAYASATALVKRTEEALAAGRTARWLAKRLAAGEELEAKTIDQAAEEGDEVCREMIFDTARYLAVGIVNLMHTIDPDGILLGGAMTFGGKEKLMGRMFLDRVHQEVFLRAYPTVFRQTTIDYAVLGGDAGFIGAAGLARRDYSARK